MMSSISIKNTRTGLLAVMLVTLLLSGCGKKNDSVKQAKEAVRNSIARTNATTGTASAQAPPSYMDSERYLPTQERLRRRQERLQAVLDKQPQPKP